MNSRITLHCLNAISAKDWGRRSNLAILRPESPSGVSTSLLRHVLMPMLALADIYGEDGSTPAQRKGAIGVFFVEHDPHVPPPNRGDSLSLGCFHDSRKRFRLSRTWREGKGWALYYNQHARGLGWRREQRRTPAAAPEEKQKKDMKQIVVITDGASLSA